MSATVETNNVSWRKRRRQEEEAAELQIEMKKPRYYYYRLASESSKNSEEDTESVYSLQDHETDVVRDTTDTDSKSGSDNEYELIEYEVASLSESDHAAILGNSTSDSDDQVIFAAAMGAICDVDVSLETWITDGEESDNSSLDDSVVTRLGFSTCVQCNLQNDNPLYRYCEKCFQDRKKFYPPRPRKKAKRKPSRSPVKLDTLRSCLSGLSSQDSGIGSSQECPPLDLDQIVVPDQHLKPGTSEISTIPDNLNKEHASKDIERNLKRKRQASESSLSDFDIKKPKLNRIASSQKDRNVRSSSRNNSQVAQTLSDVKPSTSTKNLGQRALSLNRASNELSQKSTETLSQKSIETLSQKSTETLSQTSTETLSQKSTETLSQTSIESSIPLSQTSERSLTLRSAQTQYKPLSFSQNSEVSTSTGYSSTSTFSESSELCIMCNSAPKDSIFLHTNIGHQCCCYRCAKRTLHTFKRCPICNRSVNKVIRIFQA
ncbi:unnamed protein product [Psylliodes chrysocephalus]|uniref:Uncharacterized protein n=1 Tax=Psylliodes chrysocephalus TaxID=3402493 RepID=A0A9P0CJD0_9CUCU|nr:unnamed protein product [Psylliodes chrysocephala]